MEILKRKIQGEATKNNGIFHASLIDGERLSMRWGEKKDENLPEKKDIEKVKGLERPFRALKEVRKINDEDLVINFTKEETERIKRIFRRDC